MTAEAGFIPKETVYRRHHGRSMTQQGTIVAVHPDVGGCLIRWDGGTTPEFVAFDELRHGPIPMVEVQLYLPEPDLRRLMRSRGGPDAEAEAGRLLLSALTQVRLENLGAGN